MKANWSGNIFHRNCLPQLVIEGKRYETRRRGRRRKHLLDDEGKEKVLQTEGKGLDPTIWRTSLEEAMNLS